MVAPGREDLVSENPYLDEVITYSVSIPKLIYGDGEEVIPDGSDPPTDVSPCITHIPCTHPIPDRL